MSRQDTPTQEPFAFLRTVVDQGSNLNENKNGTDSDKENEQKNLVGHDNSPGKDLGNSYNNINKDNLNKGTADMDAETWDDFFYEEDCDEIKKDNEESQQKENEWASFQFEIPNDRVLDKVEEEEEDDNIDMSNATDTVDSSRVKDTGENNTNDTDNKLSDSEKKNKRKRRKRLFKRRPPPPLSPKSRSLRSIHMSGSDPNLNGNHDLSSRINGHGSSFVSSDQDGGHHFETMSETGVGGNNRKLNRRKQVSRPRCAGPKQTGNSRLEQKYQELEELILKPLPNPAGYIQQTRQQIQRLQNLNSQNHNNSHSNNPPVSNGLPPTGQQRDPERTHTVTQVIEEDTNQIYSTMKSVHSLSTSNKKNRPNSAHPQRRPTSAPRQRITRPQSAGNARPSTASYSTSQTNSISSYSHSNSHRGRKGQGNRGLVLNRKSRSDSSTSRGSPKVSERGESGIKDREDDYLNSFEDGDGNASRSTSRSPGRTIQHTDNHIKNSENPALQEWLKVKDKEHRKKKREERKKKSKERAEKQEEVIRKQELLEKAEEKVKEWMIQKKREAREQAKIEQKRRKEVEKELAERQNVGQTESLRGQIFIPITRPPGKFEEGDNNNNTTQMKQQQRNLNDAITTPTPPPSKFVYKRPVSGRVRLMKLQQERKEDSKNLEERKKEIEKVLTEEKERKMRMSYDQWLLKKREEDYAKRKESARQRTLAKSDPELDRLVPEMARRRIENIKRGKRSINAGDQAINKELNSSFGGGDFGEERENTNSNASYRLEVSGDRKSLKQRPSSAKPSTSDEMLNPKISRSPRRPQSANPRMKALMDESKEANPDNSFKLPFPAELGVPKYIAAKQEKLFGSSVLMSDSKDMSSVSNADLSVDGGDKNKAHGKSATENDVKEGDVVDAESEVDPELKSVVKHVIDDLKTDSVEEKFEELIENTKDQSFFVTDGNLDNDKGDEEKMKTKEENDVKESSGDIDDKSNKNDENMNVNSSENIISNKNIDEEESSSNGVDYIVPPLDIGDDDDDYDENGVAYDEEEEEEENENKMDTTGSGSAREKREDEVELENEKTNKSKSYDEEDGVFDSLEVKSSIKRVSFSDKEIIHEDPLIGVSNDYDFFDDDDFEENQNQGEWCDRHEENNQQFNDVESDYKEMEDYKNLDEIETENQQEDYEAEDERGDYFGNTTPRDDDF